MANRDAAELGLFGTGWQAESQLAAVVRARPIKVAYVYSRNEPKRNDFAGPHVRAAADRSPRGRPATGGRRGFADRRHGHDQPRAGVRRHLAGRGRRWSAPSARTGSTRPRSTATSSAAPTTSSATASRPARTRPAISSTAIEKGIFDWSRAVDLADVLFGQSHGPQHPREHRAVQIGRPGDRRRRPGHPPGERSQAPRPRPRAGVLIAARRRPSPRVPLRDVASAVRPAHLA